VRIESAGMTVFVHEDVVREHPGETALRFHFGQFGWCRIGLDRALRTYLAKGRERTC